MAPNPEFPDRLGQGEADRSDNASDVAKQYADENIGLKRQLAELQGICERTIAIGRKRRAELANKEMWSMPSSIRQLGLVALDDIENELAKAK